MMLDFQRYQLEFTSHIRSPGTAKKPSKVPDARIAVYREIVFNNVFGSVSACFPVCADVLGKRSWLRLIKQFFATHQATTPLFREIPQEFLTFLSSATGLPNYLQQLAHYEWVELAVNMQHTVSPAVSKTTDLFNEKPVLAPANKLLEYDFPVHKISKKLKPLIEEKTYLLVFRNAELKASFIELNPMTYLLLKLLENTKLTGKQALTKLAKDIQHPDINIIIQFGLKILEDLTNQQAIIGSVKK